MTTTEISTETKKPLILTVTVKDVIFRTNGLGKMFPIVLFNENKELNKLGVDAMMYDSIVRMNTEKLGAGSKIKVEFDSNTMAPTIKNFIKERVKPVEIPANCSSCHHEYIKKDVDYFCSNYVCSARDRGFLYKMIRMVSPATSWETVSEFLNKFPVSIGTESIDSFAEYHYITREMKHFNTKPRLDAWVKNHGEETGEELFKLENELQDFFNKEELPISWFWHICNFPLISEEVFYELVNLSPREFVNGEDNKGYSKLSNAARKYIDHNLDMVIWLLKFFDSYGEKTWKHFENHLGLSKIVSSEN